MYILNESVITVTGRAINVKETIRERTGCRETAGTSVDPDSVGVYRPQITHKSARTGTVTQQPQHLWLHDLYLGVETAVIAPWHACGSDTGLQYRNVDNMIWYI
jgi:hypothetical protein